MIMFNRSLEMIFNPLWSVKCWKPLPISFQVERNGLYSIVSAFQLRVIMNTNVYIVLYYMCIFSVTIGIPCVQFSFNAFSSKAFSSNPFRPIRLGQDWTKRPRTKRRSTYVYMIDILALKNGHLMYELCTSTTDGYANIRVYSPAFICMIML